MYQTIVLEKADMFLKMLTEIEFFKDNEINNTEFAKKYFCDILTEKFIDGKINDDVLFEDDEIEKILKEIIVGSVLHELKRKGYVDSLDNENSEETFFLTEEGKEYLKYIQDNSI